MKTFTYNTDFYNRPESQVFVEAPEDTKFMLEVKAINGDFIRRPYSNRESASRALDYYLKKFDKINVGASGTWFRVAEVKVAA